MDSPRWQVITQSPHERERIGLDFLRAGLPNHDPYRAWANFEFQTPDGAIYEVDLLVLTKQGFWLVELKDWTGRIEGDAAAWRITRGRNVESVDNPVLLANRKAKALASLLGNQPAITSARGVRVPWLDALVFLSSDAVQCDLSGIALNRVLLKDRPAEESRKERKGILAALMNRQGPGIDPECRSTIDAKVAKALSRAVEQAGIRPSQRSRRVGDYLLGELLAEGPGYQDRLAKRVQFDDMYCRVRLYSVAQADSEEVRQRRKRAAAREFQIIRSLNHPHILPVLDYREHELGPALLFNYLDPHAIRFDHYLATHGHKLTTEQRIKFLRQITDAIRYAHRHRVVHRALSPQSILVMKDEGGRARNALAGDAPLKLAEAKSLFEDPAKLYIQIFNWQVGIRDASTNSGRVTNVENLVEAQSFVYMAPEAISDQQFISESSDVFSLGALAFHLFAGRPPASSPSDLTRILREHKGLSLAAVQDAVGPKLEEMIKWCTHPDVNTRVGSVDDFLALLDEVEDELTSPEEVFVHDPLSARRGDRLEGGFVVDRELGQGATAKALLVSKDDQSYVLKIALTDADNSRLHEEAEALRRIQSEFIVAIRDELEMAGRTVLVLQKAGDETLASTLRKDGVPSLELLGRYGGDLLAAVESLERHGVAHRDIKPDNIGIRSLTKQRNQLILFDFSLTGAPLDNIRVGTPGYIDPFLSNRKPPKWDLAAERYATAVTLYEMAAGLGVQPMWGDGKSDPAVTDVALVIDAEKFDPSIREGLVEFFHTALHRDPTKRFDNAKEMLQDWEQVFRESERRKVRTPSGEEIDVSVALEQIDLRTPIAALGLSNRARNALERANILTVRELLLTPIIQLHTMRGVGNQTRREITEFVSKVRERFPELLDEVGRPAPSEPASSTASDHDSDANVSLELLEQKVLGARNAKLEGQWNIRTALLKPTGTSESGLHWPSQADVAASLAISTVKVNEVVNLDRNRWSKDRTLNKLRKAMSKEICRLSGIMTITETVEFVLLHHPPQDTLDSFKQQQMASVVARALIETESILAEPNFELRRIRGKSIVTCTRELATYAETLGRVADELAQSDPLLPPLRVFQELFDVTQPAMPEGYQPFLNERLLRLASSMSHSAAVSAKQELYPRGMQAERALRLGIGTLTGLGLGDQEGGLSIEQIRARVESRYPEAERLPDRPELDALLERVGLNVHWDVTTSTYHRNDLSVMFTSGSSVPRRRTTAHSTRDVEVTPEMAEARQFEERLQRAYDEGGFLVLMVRPSRMRACEANLLKRFDVERVSFDELLFGGLRTEAAQLDIDWRVIQQADGASSASQDWKNLLHLVSMAQPKLEQQLLDRREHVLLVQPGLVARYDMMSLLESLRDHAGHDAKCPGVWVLVATDEQSDMPMIDNAEIPLISPGQRTKVSEPWIDNLHRGRSLKTATVSLDVGGK